VNKDEYNRSYKLWQIINIFLNTTSIVSESYENSDTKLQKLEIFTECLSYSPNASTQARSLFRHCPRRAWRERLLRADCAWVHVPSQAVVTVLCLYLKTKLLLALHVYSTLVNYDVAVSLRLAKIKRRVNKNVTAGSISPKQSKTLQQTRTEVPMLLSMVYVVCIAADQRKACVSCNLYRIISYYYCYW